MHCWLERSALWQNVSDIDIIIVTMAKKKFIPSGARFNICKARPK